jgi:hypothetical protein
MLLVPQGCLLSKMHVPHRSCSSRLHFVKAACTIKDPCFSIKHATKAPYSSRWLHVLQGCMLPMIHAPLAAYLPWLHVPQDACIVTTGASFHVFQNLNKVHVIKCCMFLFSYIYSRLHVPPRMHVSKTECTSYIEYFPKLHALFLSFLKFLLSNCSSSL